MHEFLEALSSTDGWRLPSGLLQSWLCPGLQCGQDNHLLSLELRFTISQKAGWDQIDLHSPAGDAIWMLYNLWMKKYRKVLGVEDNVCAPSGGVRGRELSWGCEAVPVMLNHTPY